MHIEVVTSDDGCDDGDNDKPDCSPAGESSDLSASSHQVITVPQLTEAV